MTTRPRSIVVIAVVAAALIGTVCALRSSRRLGAKERIEAEFAEAARAAEKRDVGEVVKLLSERFTGTGQELRVTRDEARRLLAFELLRGQWVSVTISSAEVVVEGRRARANVDAVLSRAGKEKGLSGLLPGEASVHRFRLELEEEEEGEWRIVSGEWRQIGIEEALSGPGAPDW